MKKALFVLTTGRAGTQSLRRILGRHGVDIKHSEDTDYLGPLGHKTTYMEMYLTGK